MACIPTATRVTGFIIIYLMWRVLYPLIHYLQAFGRYVCKSKVIINNFQKEYVINLKPITKNEFNYLIKKNVLKQVHGNYGDQLVVVNKQANKSKKQRFVTDPIYNYLLRLQSQEKLEVSKVKHNQTYLFSESVL